MLGYLYETGKAVSRSNADAVVWYQEAAAQGNASAQYHLALLYSHGSGIPRNEPMAVRWLQQAAHQGLSSAQFELGRHYLYGCGVAQNTLLAYQYLIMASIHVGSKAIDSRDLVNAALTAEQIAEIQDETRNWQSGL